MITHVVIHNIAVIKNVEIEFTNGLCVLSGETGGGKSIIIGALAMLLGQKTSRDVIRSGEDAAWASAVFHITNPKILDKLSQFDVCPDEDGNIVIWRQICQDGRGSVKINGMPKTVTTLREIGDFLIHIHGQKESGVLYNPSSHLGLLDDWAKEELAPILTEYQTVYTAYKQTAARLKTLQEIGAQQKNESAFLRAQIDEIETAKLIAGEETELTQKLEVLGNFDTLRRKLGLAHSVLAGGEQNVHDSLYLVLKELETLDGLGPQFDALYKSVKELCYLLDDNIASVSDLLGGIEYSPQQLAAMNERMAYLQALSKKYNMDSAQMIDHLAQLKEKLDNIEHSQEKIDACQAERLALLPVLKETAERLSNTRIDIGEKLSQQIEGQLCDLDLAGSRFCVMVSPSKTYTKTGKDVVEFFISTNKGEAPKPLAKVASGGELSRIVLAMKTVMAQCDDNDTYIFDEIDQGLSGSASDRVARKLCDIAKQKQTIVITHSPQVAAAANSHYLIEKQLVGDKNETFVKKLDQEQRAWEIARIGAGLSATKITYEYAKELLHHYE